MKKKLTIVLALGLALVTLLSACGSTKAVTISNVLNQDATYEEETYLFERGSEVSALAGTTVVKQEGDIIYFVAAPDLTLATPTFERHVVYNVEEGKVLYNVSETNKTEINISLDQINEKNVISGSELVSKDGDSFFVVQTTRYNLGEGDIRENVSNEETVLYDGLGNKLEELTGLHSATTALDTVYFNGKCYRAEEDGSLAYAFDYSVLSAFPERVNAQANGKYYEFVSSGDKGVKIYDDEFNFVQEFEIPVYADFNGYVLLEDEKILLQYSYELEEDAKKYSFLFTTSGASEQNMTKHQLHTVVYDPAKDEAKEIDCSYLLVGTMIGREHEDKFEQLDPEFTQALVYGMPIVDKRVSVDTPYLTLGVNEKGEFFEIDGINGETVYTLRMLGENRWLASTARFAYLVDGEETVLGEISEAEMTGKFFYKNGKIFDSDLELIYDCASNKMTLVDVLDGAFLLKNYDGEIFCYTGGEGKPEKIITKKEAKTSEVTVLDSGLFVVCDRSNPADVNYDFYNAEGEKIFSTDAIAGCNINPDDVIRTESAVLVPYNINGVYAYYKIR